MKISFFFILNRWIVKIIFECWQKQKTVGFWFVVRTLTIQGVAITLTTTLTPLLIENSQAKDSVPTIPDIIRHFCMLVSHISSRNNFTQAIDVTLLLAKSQQLLKKIILLVNFPGLFLSDSAIFCILSKFNYTNFG